MGMTEQELQDLVIMACRRMGLLYYHTHDSRRSEPGFPDLVIVGLSGILFRELKSRQGQLTPEQRRWGSRITAGRGNWAVWRPVDWQSGVIFGQLLDLK